LFSIATISFWIVAAVGWRWIAPYPPSEQGAVKFLPPSRDHFFGTDGFGRDVFSRVLAGAELVLTVAPLTVLLATVVGTSLGLITGYYGGLVDGASMRVLEAIAILPGLFPAILIVSLLGNSDGVLIVVLAFAFAPIVTRTVRAATLVEREKQYVEAARLRDESTAYILGREILPNISGSIGVEATGRLADAVFAIATLSFVGLGAQAGSPDWGAQVADNRVNIQFAWWTVLFPAFAVASLVVAVSLLADVLRERRGLS
jgi:peptide/nickel transport system permease protein